MLTSFITLAHVRIPLMIKMETYPKNKLLRTIETCSNSPFKKQQINNQFNDNFKTAIGIAEICPSRATEKMKVPVSFSEVLLQYSWTLL